MYFLSLEPPANGKFFSAVESMLGDWVYRVPHYRPIRKRFQTKEELREFLRKEKVKWPFLSGSAQQSELSLDP